MGFRCGDSSTGKCTDQQTAYRLPGHGAAGVDRAVRTRGADRVWHAGERRMTAARVQRDGVGRRVIAGAAAADDPEAKAPPGTFAERTMKSVALGSTRICRTRPSDGLHCTEERTLGERHRGDLRPGCGLAFRRSRGSVHAGRRGRKRDAGAWTSRGDRRYSPCGDALVGRGRLPAAGESGGSEWTIGTFVDSWKGPDMTRLRRVRTVRYSLSRGRSSEIDDTFLIRW